MQNKYRYVSCPQCNKTLRLAVKDEERLGKTINVTCASCGKEFETILPLSEARPNATTEKSDGDETDVMTEKDFAIIKPLVEEFGNTLHEAVETSPELGRVVEKFRTAGYNPVLMFAATMGISKIGSPAHEPVPLVKDGEVVPEAFTADDGAWLQDWHIKLGP